MSGRTRVPALPFSVRGPASPFWTGFSVTLTETFGATVLALPIAVAGALKPRLSVEVRTDALGQEAQVSAMSRGRPLDAEWTLWYEGAPATSLSTANAVINVTSLNAIECAAPSAGIAQMQIWVHADTAEGNSQPVPAIIELLQSDAVRRLVVEERSGVCLIPLDAEQVRARISFSARLVTPAPTP